MRPMMPVLRRRLSYLCLFVLITALACETTGSRVPIPRGRDRDERERPARSESGPDLSAVEWDTERIHNGDGITYLVTADFPCPVDVSAHAAFRGAGVIEDVKPSPDGRMLAIRTRTTSHGMGWLYDPRGGNLRPVSFQYGGETKLVGWREDGEYVAFLERTPGPGDFLRLVGVSERHDYVADYGLDVGQPGADVELPSGVMGEAIEPEGWNGPYFFFHCGDAFFRIDPAEGDLEDAEEASAPSQATEDLG